MFFADGSREVMYDANMLSQSKMTYPQSVSAGFFTKSHERETGRIGPSSVTVHASCGEEVVGGR